MYELRHFRPTDTAGQVVTGWQTIVYWQRLNGLQQLERLEFPHNSYWAGALRDDARLTISRHHEIAWHGHLTGDSWQEPRNAPAGQVVTFAGKGLEEDALLSTVLPRAWLNQVMLPNLPSQMWVQDYEYWPGAQTAAADDMCKALVRGQMVHRTNMEWANGPGGRDREHITVADNTTLAPVISARLCGGDVLKALVDMAEAYGIWWRFVPSESGAVFTTRYPLWGADRTAGDGQCVLSTEVGTLASIDVDRSWDDVRNAVYLNGQGSTRSYVVREDAASIALYRRREIWVDIDRWGMDDYINDAAYEVLRQHRMTLSLKLVPAPGVYRQRFWLGDKVVVRSKRGDRPFSWDATITGVQHTIGQDGVEHITEVEALVG